MLGGGGHLCSGLSDAFWGTLKWLPGASARVCVWGGGGGGGHTGWSQGPFAPLALSGPKMEQKGGGALVW